MERIMRLYVNFAVYLVGCLER